MSSARAPVLEEIRRRGPIDFARFMELALYHPERGYYASGGRRTGWSGHFVTSPELDPAYGELWGRAFAELWRVCGRPGEFVVVEVGAGEAGFAAAVLSSADPEFRRALRYVLVEPSSSLRTRQRARLEGFDRVSWSTRIEDLGGYACGCLFANEVLDNQPVRLVEGVGRGVMELLVDSSGDRLAWTRRPPPDDLLTWLRQWSIEPAEGERIAAPRALQRLVGRAAGLVRCGAVVFVDYGLEAEELRARPTGTVASYSTAGADDRVLEDPGARDITTHVNWTLVRRWLAEAGARPRGPFTQRAVLRALGATALDDAFAAAARSGRGAEVVRALSRRQALGALLDPAGLGGLGVMLGFVGGTELHALAIHEQGTGVEPVP